MNITSLNLVSDINQFSHVGIDARARAAAAGFMAAGSSGNTARSYRSAFEYWETWLSLRYPRGLEDKPLGLPLNLGDGPLAAGVVVTFIVDHLEPPDGASWVRSLPEDVDAALVASGVKAKLGALSYNTVRHRLAVLAKWHDIKGWPTPTDSSAVRDLLRKTRNAQARANIKVQKKTAAVREPLEAMLATCSDGVRGIRDRALILLAWSGGGRRRSEVVGLQVGDVRQLDADTWVYSLGVTKTNTDGVPRELPLRGVAAHALAAWLAKVPDKSGPLFRRVYKGGRVGTDGLSGDQVARIVKRRAELANLKGKWAAHSLRSGFVSEAGRQGVPLGEVMAMTEHRTIATVMGYYQAGQLLESRASMLLGSEGLSEGGEESVIDRSGPQQTASEV